MVVNSNCAKMTFCGGMDRGEVAAQSAWLQSRAWAKPHTREARQTDLSQAWAGEARREEAQADTGKGRTSWTVEDKMRGLLGCQSCMHKLLTVREMRTKIEKQISFVL